MNSTKYPMFLRFINKETGVQDLLNSFVQAREKETVNAAKRAMQSPPDLEEFRTELEDAVTDLVKEGLDEDFKDFVNHYMEPSLEEVMEVSDSPLGENRTQTAFVKDDEATWIEGFICYNLCLYIKAFGLSDLKKCKVCGKLFAHKGKYALYCNNACKSVSKKKREKDNGGFQKADR